MVSRSVTVKEKALENQEVSVWTWLLASIKCQLQNEWNSTSTPPCDYVACSETVSVLCFMVIEVVRHAVVHCVSQDYIYTPSQYVSCQLVKAVLRHPVLFVYQERINSLVFLFLFLFSRYIPKFPQHFIHSHLIAVWHVQNNTNPCTTLTVIHLSSWYT